MFMGLLNATINEASLVESYQYHLTPIPLLEGSHRVVIAEVGTDNPLLWIEDVSRFPAPFAQPLP